MKKEKKYIKKIAIFFTIAVITLTIVYLMISTNLINIETKEKLSSATWNIHFENLKESVKGNTKVIKSAQLAEKSTYIGDYEVIFTKTGDELIYTFDVVNSGNLDAILSSIVKSSLKCESSVNNKNDEDLVCNNLKYTLKYTNGNELKEYTSLNKNERINLILSLRYEGKSLPTSKVKIKGLDIVLHYNQK